MAFDESLRFQSATWVAAGFNGGKLPKHAKKEMYALALAGSLDGNRDAAEKTPDLLEDKVRSADCRLQPGLDHKWPDRLMPFLTWWLGVTEGRYVPGECAAFEWAADEETAVAAAKERKTGTFVWWYSATDDVENPRAKAFQNDVLRDAAVFRFGNQLLAAKRDRATAEEECAKVGIKATPAVVVRDATGAVKTVLQGKIDAKALTAALRGVAPEKK